MINTRTNLRRMLTLISFTRLHSSLYDLSPVACQASSVQPVRSYAARTKVRTSVLREPRRCVLLLGPAFIQRGKFVSRYPLRIVTAFAPATPGATALLPRPPQRPRPSP